mmetsp:Transcript_82364/g.191267  ORF Transcript_82364/g.191267 Transcript_82364/m.191267 type:complete len:369 (+) Transcript_82364:449-1555(+)
METLQQFLHVLEDSVTHAAQCQHRVTSDSRVLVPQHFYYCLDRRRVGGPLRLAHEAHSAHCRRRNSHINILEECHDLGLVPSAFCAHLAQSLCSHSSHVWARICEQHCHLVSVCVGTHLGQGLHRSIPRHGHRCQGQAEHASLGEDRSALVLKAVVQEGGYLRGEVCSLVTHGAEHCCCRCLLATVFRCEALGHFRGQACDMLAQCHNGRHCSRAHASVLVPEALAELLRMAHAKRAHPGKVEQRLRLRRNAAASQQLHHPWREELGLLPQVRKGSARSGLHLWLALLHDSQVGSDVAGIPGGLHRTQGEKRCNASETVRRVALAEQLWGLWSSARAHGTQTLAGSTGQLHAVGTQEPCNVGLELGAL